MKVIAEKWSFGAKGQVREINIPDHEADGGNVLELAFKYGQNDFQPVAGISSLSVGDIVNIEANGELEQHLVLGCGWHKFEGHYDYLDYILKCMKDDFSGCRDAVWQIEKANTEPAM